MATAKKTLTIRSLMAIFATSHTTIIAWSRGEVPSYKGKMPREADKLAAWANKNDIKMHANPEKQYDAQCKASRQNGTARVSRTKRATTAPMKRTGAGRVTSVRAGAKKPQTARA